MCGAQSPECRALGGNKSQLSNKQKSFEGHVQQHCLTGKLFTVLHSAILGNGYDVPG